MDEVRNIEDLQEQVRQGRNDWQQFGNVRAAYKEDLVLFNYTAQAQYEGRWNWFERVSRGLMLNTETGEVVARPFDRFWNWGERGRTSDGHIVSVTAKVDGSLGILYRDPTLPPIATHRIATRGSFDSEQAEWATQHLYKFYDLCDLPDEYTLLFEIVYPDNRIVVDYDGEEDLYLLAVRNRHTGEYLPLAEVHELAGRYEFPTPMVYDFGAVDDIAALLPTLDGNAEGYVAEMSDGTRWKFKGDRYMELHRLVTNATFKRVLEAVANGAYEEMIAVMPTELRGEILAFYREIDAKVREITNRVEMAYAESPDDDRKTFALWVKREHPDLAPYLFQHHDGRDCRPMIYKLAFRDREE